MKTCSIKGCPRPAKAKGLCRIHYDRTRRGSTDMRPEKMACWDTRQRPQHEPCKVEGCGKKYHALGYCRHHYENFQRTGSPTKNKYKDKTMVKCKIDGCERKVSSLSRYGMCAMHIARFRRGIDLLKPLGNKGEYNSRWNGGTSVYPNHYELKKNRLIVLNAADWKCSVCGQEATSVIHKDRSRDNHAVSNLEARCRNCIQRNRGKVKTSKFIRAYGKTIKQITEEFGLSNVTIIALHRKGKLKDIIQKAT